MDKFIKIASIASIAILSGCESKEDTFGEKLQTRADDVHIIGEEWSKGSSIVKEGTDLTAEGQQELKSAEAVVSRARAKIDRGESLVRKGNAVKFGAENTYRERVTHPVTIPR